MTSLVNGQCAHRYRGHGRCLELATMTRPITDVLGSVIVVYDIPLCPDHADYYDVQRQRIKTGG